MARRGGRPVRLWSTTWITLSGQIHSLKSDQGRTDGMGFYTDAQRLQWGSHRLFRLLVLRSSVCTAEVFDKRFYGFEQFLLQHDWLDKPILHLTLPQEWYSSCSTGAHNIYNITGNNKQQITTLCCISVAGRVIPLVHIYPGEDLGIILWRVMWRAPTLGNPRMGGWCMSYFKDGSASTAQTISLLYGQSTCS